VEVLLPAGLTKWENEKVGCIAPVGGDDPALRPTGANPMCQFFERTGTVVGRILLGLIFLASGIHKATTFNNTVEQVKGVMTGAGIPEGAVAPLIVAAIVFEIVGAVLIILGLFARLGAVLLIIFLLVATPIFHNFWSLEPNTPKYQEQMINCMKNVSILGGMIFLLARGPGFCSIDNLWRKKVQATPGATS
jgi:putative oxidoreductase